MSVFLKSSTLKRRGLAGVLGERISEAVAKVEDGRMAVLPKIRVGLARQVRMVDFCAPVIKSGRGGRTAAMASDAENFHTTRSIGATLISANETHDRAKHRGHLMNADVSSQLAPVNVVGDGRRCDPLDFLPQCRSGPVGR